MTLPDEPNKCLRRHVAWVVAIAAVVFGLLAAFWNAERTAMSAFDERLRPVEQRQAAVIANQAMMMESLRRIEAKLEARQTRTP
jgi:hypothetical protein